MTVSATHDELAKLLYRIAETFRDRRAMSQRIQALARDRSRLAQVQVEIQSTLDQELDAREALWRCVLRDEIGEGDHPAWLEAMTLWTKAHNRLEELATLEDRLMDDRLGRVWAGATH